MLPPQRPAVRAVVFDHDGTLVDTVRADFLSCSALFEEYGAPLPARRWAAEVCGHPDGYDRLLAMLHALGGPPVAALRVRLESHWERFFTPEHIRLLPGVRELLDALRADGARLAVASAADGPWVGRWLTHFSIADRFEAVVTGDQVPFRKPHPAVYLEAAARLGVPPEECAAVEDSITGVAAARAAGMTVIAVPTELTRHCDFTGAHHLLPGMAALKALAWLRPGTAR
ncbi:HAD-IA family hydrolase [Streptomyces sp. NPDC001985]|uniref:HAD family hydrolase n=1 Tax=Streptomyces sp. NPDC001985 TaxID=3154406 RepID=UPI00332A64FA